MQLPEPPPLDYIEALEARDRSAQLDLGGEKHTVRRARLGLHYRLLDVLSGEDQIRAVLQYVSLATGIPEDDLNLEEVGPAYQQLRQLNAPVGVAALQIGGGNGSTPMALDYRGRGLAAVVHELAFAYGWTPDYILNELGPEEGWCYLQEVHVDRHFERAFLRTLSTVGRNKQGHQERMPDPSWLRIGYQRRHQLAGPVPPEGRPSGKVINLNQVARERRTR